jgi:hypothetical protein
MPMMVAGDPCGPDAKHWEPVHPPGFIDYTP